MVLQKKIYSQNRLDVGSKKDTFGSDDEYVEDSDDSEYIESMLKYETDPRNQTEYTRDGIKYRSTSTQSFPLRKRKTTKSGHELSLSTDGTGSDESNWDEEALEDDGLYGSSTINSTWGESQSVDDRSLILAEIIDIGKLKELKQDDESAHDIMGSRRLDRPINEIRCSKVTGTAKNHIEEVGYPSSTDEDKENYDEKEKRETDVLFSVKQNTKLKHRM